MSEVWKDAFWQAFSSGTIANLAALVLLGVATAIVITALLVILFLRSTWRDIIRYTFLSVGLAVVGAVAGYLGGLGDAGAVGLVLPAVLALAGGLSLYLFGVGQSQGLAASAGLLAFVVALFLGQSFGAKDRLPTVAQVCSPVVVNCPGSPEGEASNVVN